MVLFLDVIKASSHNQHMIQIIHVTWEKATTSMMKLHFPQETTTTLSTLKQGEYWHNEHVFSPSLQLLVVIQKSKPGKYLDQPFS